MSPLLFVSAFAFVEEQALLAESQATRAALERQVKEAEAATDATLAQIRKDLAETGTVDLKVWCLSPPCGWPRRRGPVLETPACARPPLEAEAPALPGDATQALEAKFKQLELAKAAAEERARRAEGLAAGK